MKRRQIIITLLLLSTVNFAKGQLTIYRNLQNQGSSAICEQSIIYKGSTIPGGLNDRIRSIKLQKGYMATIAANEDGSGYGFNYVAATSDITVDLYYKLHNDVSFIRVLPIRDVKKKGAGTQDNNTASLLNATWFYDWGASDKTIPAREFVPMAWGRSGATNPARVAEYIAKPEITCLLSFNEPDGLDQSNIAYEVAVPAYKNLLKTGYRMGSPATTEAQYRVWLTNFMNGVDADTSRVDFIAIHWYDWGHWGPNQDTSPDPRGVFERFKNYINAVYNLYKRPIWVTEFNSNRNTDAATQEAFMRLALPYLDSDPRIERYAYFFPPSHPPVVNGVLTGVGKIYSDHVSTPSFPNNIIDTRPTAAPSEYDEKAFNGDFEITSPTSPIFPGWSFSTPADFVIQTGTNAINTTSVRFASSTNNRFMTSDAIEVTPGVTYRLQFTARIQSAVGPSGSPGPTRGGVFSGTILNGLTFGTTTFTTLSTTSSTNVTLSADYTVPAGQTSIRLRFRKTADIAYLDDVSFKKAPLPADTTTPVITAPADITANNIQNQCHAIVSPGLATATDNAELAPTVTGSRSDGLPLDATYPVGITTITWKAEDDAGNKATSLQTVTVVDAQAPTITAPADLNANADQDVCSATLNPGIATAIDNCTGVTTTGVRSDGLALNAAYPRGVTTINWTAKDDAGNTSTALQTITVIDAQAPIITAPAGITVNADENVCAATLNPGVAIATDNCTGVTITGIRNDGFALNAAYPRGVTTINWTAKDDAGNTATASQTVTVIDTQAPIITAPANITANADENLCSATLSPGIATATDNCTEVTVIGIRNDGLALSAAYPIGVTTLTWTATDGAGNVAQASQTVTVNDMQAPVITVNPISAKIWPANNRYVRYSLNDIIQSVTDNCGSIATENATIVSVSSNETDNRPQYRISADKKSVEVLASRNGSGNGRTYMVEVAVTDQYGNTGNNTYAILVPHDMGKSATAYTGFEDIKLLQPIRGLKAYPNSSNGNFNLEFYSPDAGRGELVIVNNSGTISFKQQLKIESGMNALTYNLNNLTTGVYIVNISTGAGVLTTKLMIVN